MHLARFFEGFETFVPQFIQDLMDGAEKTIHIVSNDPELTNDDRHKILASIMKSSSYFVASEVPVWIELENQYTGHIDLLLFDPATKTIYVTDYKPNLVYNNLGKLAFTNAIPQLAAYGLTIQEQADINLQCIIFNDEAAWIFDPALVLGPIDEFMMDQFSGWIPPWVDFFYYLSFSEFL
ncbi:hypothetical protein LCGC14_0789260 [marine sediment metagenome]|uniref:PD-(D/E)XK endonuclease-like domain-containing protein n=1 Tax=marine sediment metagenome TaxID=412755 RepID=A0A0F9PT74_9ZZZZ